MKLSKFQSIKFSAYYAFLVQRLAPYVYMLSTYYIPAFLVVLTCTIGILRAFSISRCKDTQKKIIIQILAQENVLFHKNYCIYQKKAVFLQPNYIPVINKENETNWYKSDPVHMVGTTPIVNKGRATMPAKAPKKLLPKTLGLNLQ